VKTVIAVHTGTGNSLFLASKFKDAEILFIDQLISGEKALPEDIDILGIIYPVYCFGIPNPVEVFVKDILSVRDNSNLEYLFAINTNGGTPGSANRQLELLLAENGLALAYAESIRMPDGYIPIMRKFASEMQALALVEKQGKKIEKIISDIESFQIKLPAKGLIPNTIRKIARKWNTPHKENGLKLNAKCIGCGICSRVCPTGNIEIIDGKPQFSDKCISCYACYHRCPEKALAYKNKKGQYCGLQETSKLFRR
jgi:ferredoxin